jgi:hypothetical protein
VCGGGGVAAKQKLDPNESVGFCQKPAKLDQKPIKTRPAGFRRFLNPTYYWLLTPCDVAGFYSTLYL